MEKILILHGWTHSLDKWENFIGLLNKSGFDVKIPKIPGLTLKSNQVWDLEKYSKWLGGKIGSSKTILLGHSNGGRIGAYFTAKYPERVNKLILIDSAGIYHKNLSIRIKRFVFGKAAKVGKKFTKSDVLRKFLYKLAAESDYETATPNMKKTMVNLIDTDLTETFKKIITPTLIIWGENDRVTPISDAVLINRLIKNSKLKIVKGARHSPFYTHPEQVIDIIKNDI